MSLGQQADYSKSSKHKCPKCHCDIIRKKHINLLTNKTFWRYVHKDGWSTCKYNLSTITVIDRFKKYIRKGGIERMTNRIMRRTGEYCHRCHCEIKLGERWYRYNGVRRTEERKIYHSDIEICYKNLKEVKENEK